MDLLAIVLLFIGVLIMIGSLKNPIKFLVSFLSVRACIMNVINLDTLTKDLDIIEVYVVENQKISGVTPK